MVKKKNIDTETDKENKVFESTDNKETTYQTEQEDGGETILTSDRESAEKATAEKSASGEVTDKAVDKNRIFEEKLAEMQDKYIRLSAEFDNYRKRTLREKMEISKYASEDILLKILPLMDDFERALKHMDSSNDPGAVKEGINLIYTKFGEFMKQQGVKEIESLNRSFDVDLHDAVAKVPVEETGMKGRIVDVVLKGYLLQDKVIRHSKVVIGE